MPVSSLMRRKASNALCTLACLIQMAQPFQHKTDVVERASHVLIVVAAQPDAQCLAMFAEGALRVFGAVIRTAQV
ncbi:MAG: hypothetical protein R2838_13615 [Caldilineaceae bacterium]